MKRIKDSKGVSLALLIIAVVLVIIIICLAAAIIANSGKKSGKAKVTSNSTSTASGSAATTVKDLKFGDYVMYDFGNADVQEWMPSIYGDNKIICRVLYDEQTGNGVQIAVYNRLNNSNGEAVKITLGVEDPTIPGSMNSASDWEKAKYSYNHLVETLNEAVKPYFNSKYAIDYRSLGSVPTVNSSGKFTNKNSETTNTLKLPYEKWSDEEKSRYTRPEGLDSDDTGLKGEDDNYKYDYEAIQQMKQNDENSGKTTSSLISGSAWLASRHIVGDYELLANEDSNMANSCMVYISAHNLEKEKLDQNEIRGAINTIWADESKTFRDLFGYSVSDGIIPCFSLKTNVKIKSGNGTMGSPYVLE